MELELEGVPEELNWVFKENLDYAPARRRVRTAFLEVQHQVDYCLFQNVPTGVKEEEWYETNSRGIEIFCMSWVPEEEVPIKGVVCWTPGYSCTCSYIFAIGIAKRIASHGYAVHAMDYYGHGLSEGLHGYIPSFDLLIEDVREHYKNIRARSELKGLPFFLFGQSLGGTVSLLAYSKERHLWDGLVLVAPMIKVADGIFPSKPLMKVLSAMSILIPKAKIIPKKNAPEMLYYDSTKIKMERYDIIKYNGKMRLKTALEHLKALTEVQNQLDKVACPFLVFHGDEDKAMDPMGSQMLYEKATSKDKTIKMIKGGNHCLIEGEPDDVIFSILQDIMEWFDSHSHCYLS